MLNNSNVRNEIIKKSYHLILNKGYKGATVNDILDLVNISKGSFYYYFASKRDVANLIIDEIIKKEFSDIWHDVHEGDNPIKNIIKKINLSYNEKGDRYLSTGCPLGNLILELASVDAEFSKKINSILKIWSAYVKKALDRSKELGLLNAKFNPENVADFLVASVEGCILLSKSYHDKKKLRNCFDSVIDYIELISEG